MELDASRPTSTLQASSRLRRLVGLDVRHDYFNAEADVCRAIEVEPTPRTLRRARAQGMAVRTRRDGFDLFVSDRRAAAAPVRPPPAQGRQTLGSGAVARPVPLAEPPFLFTMRLRDLGFAGYTEMPADLVPGDPPLLFSNRGAREGHGGSGPIEPDWSATIGDVTFAGDDAERERSAFARSPGPFGLFELHLPSAVPTDPGEPLVHELRFTARRTLWRYIVAARDGGPAPDALEIVDARAAGDGPSPDAAFDRLADGWRLPDGRTAVAFACRSAMPLRQRAEGRFALRGLPAGGLMRRRTLVDPLPAASPRSTVFDVAPSAGARPPSTPWSDIYVFV